MTEIHMNVTHTVVFPKDFPCCEAKGETEPRPHQVGDRVTLTGPALLADGRNVTVESGRVYFGGQGDRRLWRYPSKNLRCGFLPRGLGRGLVYDPRAYRARA